MVIDAGLILEVYLAMCEAEGHPGPPVHRDLMRVYLSVDMEGISGVTRWQDVITSGQDYQRARSWMTADVNAAVAGARDAGATEFVVEENHGVEMLCNLLLDEIDPAGGRGAGHPPERGDDRGRPRRRLRRHVPRRSPRQGRRPGRLRRPHHQLRELRGGPPRRARPVSEGEIFAIMAAQVGVPTALIAGDDVVCAEMAKVSPGHHARPWSSGP